MSNPVPELLKLLGPAVLLGWPRGTKGTPRKWKHLSLADMTPGYLSKLQHGNIGVALGEVSGGLCAIDCDTDTFAELFLSANPDLKATPQTHGARARVFWVRFKGDYPKRTTKLKTHSGEEVGEFRSNGSQSIICGIHPDTGKPYRFLVKQPVLVIDFNSIRWPAEILNPPAVQRDRDTEDTEDTEKLMSSLSLCLSVSSISEAVSLCIPEGVHQNDRRLFDLARALKALEAKSGPLTHNQKIGAFDSWHEQTKSRRLLRASETRDEYLAKFLHALRKAKVPFGYGPAERAWALALSEPLPPEANLFEEEAFKRIVALCFQLSRMATGEPWFLSGRTAARLTGQPHATIVKVLSALVEVGILQVTETHTTARATRYRYVLLEK